MINDENITIYANDCELYTAEYIESLPDAHDIYDQRIFTGLIKYLRNRLRLYDNNQLYTSVDFLAAAWELYTTIVYRYKQNPTEQEFILFTGMNPNIYMEYKANKYRCNDISAGYLDGRPGVIGANVTRSELLQNISMECSIGRYKLAEKGSVGGIFLSKAIDGLTDQPQQVQPVQVAAVDLESIAALMRAGIAKKDE